MTNINTFKNLDFDDKVIVDMSKLDSMVFTDMEFFQQYIPENTKVVYVQFFHEHGWYDEPDVANVMIFYKKV